MNEIETTNLIKKRVMVSAINMVIFILTIPILMYSIDNIISQEKLNGWLVITIVFFAFILHYAILPSLSHGKNIGYMIFGLRIISIDHNQKATFNIYLFHALYAIITYIKSYGFLMTKMNNRGQLLHDEKFRLTIVSANYTPEENMVVHTYEKNMLLAFALGNFVGVIGIPLLVFFIFIIIGNIIKFLFN